MQTEPHLLPNGTVRSSRSICAEIMGLVPGNARLVTWPKSRLVVQLAGNRPFPRPRFFSKRQSCGEWLDECIGLNASSEHNGSREANLPKQICAG
jgi:hypothetical protein